MSTWICPLISVILAVATIVVLLKQIYKSKQFAQLHTQGYYIVGKEGDLLFAFLVDTNESVKLIAAGDMDIKQTLAIVQKAGMYHAAVVAKCTILIGQASATLNNLTTLKGNQTQRKKAIDILMQRWARDHKATIRWS